MNVISNKNSLRAKSQQNWICIFSFWCKRSSTSTLKSSKRKSTSSSLKLHVFWNEKGRISRKLLHWGPKKNLNSLKFTIYCNTKKMKIFVNSKLIKTLVGAFEFIVTEGHVPCITITEDTLIVCGISICQASWHQSVV